MKKRLSALLFMMLLLVVAGCSGEDRNGSRGYK